jgi:hypothetical protein
MHPLIKESAEPLFQYLFRIINKYEFRKILGKDKAKEVWSLASSDGYLLKHCKLYMYQYHVEGKASPKAFAIDLTDVRVLKSVSLDAMEKGRSPMSLSEYDELETRILTDPALSVHIGKFTSKKLRFLTKSYGVTRSEIHSQLLYAAILALRKSYPFHHSELHAVNTCKSAIHNAGIGLIEYWTRDKRQALLRDGEGFQAVKVPLDVLIGLGVDSDMDDEDKVNMSSLAQLRSRLPADEQRFLSLACGQVDLGLSVFMGVDNAHAVETWRYEKYLSSVCSYLKLTEERATSLLSELRIAMG